MEKLEYKKTGTSRKRKAVENTQKRKVSKNTSKIKNTSTKVKSKNADKKDVRKKENRNNEKNKKQNNNKNVAIVPKKKNEIRLKNVPKEKNYKKTTKKNKVLIITLIIAFLGIGTYLLFTLPYFDITNIEIKGTSKYSTEEIAQKGNLSRGSNIFIQLLKGVSQNVTELPYVQSAKVKIKLPNKIEISIKERTSYFIAYDKDNNRFYKIDEEGYILEQTDITEKEDELLAYGYIFDDEVVLGSRLKEVDISKIDIYMNIKKEFENSNINGKITKVNFENSLTTITLNDKLNVIFPNDTDIKYKMSFFKSILEKIGEDSVGVIDMTKTDPVYSIF